ncbi:C-type lectin domain family 17, member A-like [Argopecten irradians]|uniref:C-type lectin domain family 17, member A-like n=1 Tax=Argopecten irradians TaxID=31199 RepID=UPI00371E9E91
MSLFILTLFMFIYVRFTEGSTCFEFGEDIRYSLLPGLKLTGEVHRHGQSYSLRGCFKECLIQQGCKAITYHRTHLTCAIGGAAAVLATTSDLNYISGSRDHLPQANDLAGVCGTHVCTEVERCVVLKSGTPVCVELTCPPDWQPFQNKCYKLVTAKKNWTEAKTDCVSLGGSLALLDTAFVSNFCYTLIRGSGLPTVLIAANDIDQEGDWTWGMGGTYIGFSRWAPGNPSGRLPEDDCGAINDSGYWVDIDCRVPYAYLCEKQLM